MKTKGVAVALLTVLAIAGLGTLGCSGKKAARIQPKQEIKAPDWFSQPPQDNDRLIGVATATSLDLQTAIDKARQDGRVEIARQMDVRMKGLSKRFVEETGLDEDAELLGMFTQVSKSVVSDSLTGSRVSKQKLRPEGGVYRAFVMMEMPIGEANKRFVEKLRAQERLYTRFRATQAFEELDREVQEYEQWKQEQLGGR
jgi:hypothetical protein